MNSYDVIFMLFKELFRLILVISFTVYCSLTYVKNLADRLSKIFLKLLPIHNSTQLYHF